MLFFSELSKRGDNPIYNLLPDTVGQLSEKATLSEESFKTITKFLFSFIGKEKQAEALVEKLISRLSK